MTSVLDLISRFNSNSNRGESTVLPKVWKYPSSSHDDEKIQKILEAEENEGKFEKTKEGSNFHRLVNGQSFELSTDSPSGTASLKVLHTPGHTQDSICLLLSDPHQNPILFSADTVLGHSTAVFEDLSAYITSLKLCISALSAAIKQAGGKEAEIKLFCGHGEVIDDGIGKLREYLQHRQDREEQVLEGLANAGEELRTAEG